MRLLLPGLPAIADAVLHQKHGVRDRPDVRRGARRRCGCGQMPYSHVPAYVIDAPYLYRRDGSPYQASDGAEWRDNLQRFAPARLGRGAPGRGRTRPGLDARRSCTRTTGTPAWPAPTWRPTRRPRAASVFTVHNLAYQGLFAQADFGMLGLPSRFLDVARASSSTARSRS